MWFATAGKKIYLSHEGAHTNWMKNILKDCRVKLEIRKIRLKGNAKIVEGGEILKLGKHALYLEDYGKADKDTINDWFSEAETIEISMISIA